MWPRRRRPEPAQVEREQEAAFRALAHDETLDRTQALIAGRKFRSRAALHRSSAAAREARQQIAANHFGELFERALRGEGHR